MSSLEESLDDIMQDNFALSVEMAYLRDDEEGRCRGTRPQPAHISEDVWDNIVWGYAEGGIQKDFFDRMNGRCSLASSLSFDLEDEEKRLLRHRAQLVEAIKPIAREEFSNNEYFNEIYTRLVK